MKTRRPRFWIRLNSGAALILSVVILLMVNYLSYRHYVRADFSKAQRYGLSPKTVHVLESLDGPVSVKVFFQENDILYEDIRNLLRQYQYHSDKLKVQWIDPHLDFSKTEEIARKYNISELNVVIFEYGDKTDYVRKADIALINDSSGVERVASFRGEVALSSAIQNLVQKTVPTVYFLTGHGERGLEDVSRRGYASIRQMMNNDNIAVRQLDLSLTRKVPEDCAALIVAGASHLLSETEVGLIDSWVERNGRLMVLTEAGTTSGLEKLLLDWGVRVTNWKVIDRSQTENEINVAFYPEGKHPTTRALSTLRVIFQNPCLVEPHSFNTTADRPSVTSLAASSKNSWAESAPNQSPVKYDSNSDLPGPVSMAVAVEKGASPKLDMQIRPSRIIVFGDTGFVSNGALTGGNPSLFLSTLNWLIDREQLMDIAPNALNDTRLKLTQAEARILFWSAVGGIPSLIALLGITLWIIRRK
jgi:ABC-type uncharacterized transport system involved in gliding motility auxiliary subunit